MKGSKRVISLIMALVMAISLCSGVWAENGSNNEENRKTQSDAGYKFVINKRDDQTDTQTLYFFNQIDDGYLTYNREVTGFRVDDNKIAGIRVFPLDKDGAIFLAFPYDGSLGTIAEGADVSSIISEHVDTDAGEAAKFNVTYMNTNDTNLYVVKLTAKEALGSGEPSDFFDFSFYTGEGESRSEYPFAIDFVRENNNEGQQGGSAIGDVERNDKTLTVKSVNNVGERIELDIDWREDWDGQIENIGLTSGVLSNLKSYGKDVFVACYCGVQLVLSKAVVADMESKVSGDNKLWIVTDYRNQDASTEDGGKAIAFRTQFYIGESFDNSASRYTLPTGQYYELGIDVKQGTDVYKLYCPSADNSKLEEQTVTVTSANYGDSDVSGMRRLSFHVAYDGMFVLSPTGYTMQQQWPWGGASSVIWTPTAGIHPTNAPQYLQEQYDLGGCVFPEIGADFHLIFPKELKEWTANCGNDWDYKWYWNENTGIITIEVNYGSAARWQAAAQSALNDDYLADGIYFRCYFGTSDDYPSMPYGVDTWFSFESLDGSLGTAMADMKMISDYHYNNGIKLASLNKVNSSTTTLTIDQSRTDPNWLCVIAMDDEAGKLAKNADYKYALELDIRPTATINKNITTESAAQVEKDRIHVTPLAGTDWQVTIPEDGTVFLRSNKYDDNQYWGEAAAELTVDAPRGCRLVEWYKQGKSEGDRTQQPIRLFLDSVEVVKLVWQRSDGSRFEESVVVEYGSATEWMNKLGSGVTVVTPGKMMDSATAKRLESNGIYVTYDPATGYFSTTLNASEVKDARLLQEGVPLLVPAEFSNAKYYKVLNSDGSENPAVHGEEYAQEQLKYFDDVQLYTVGNGTYTIPYAAIETIDANGLTVYYAAGQHYSITLVRWLDEDQNVLGYSYVYGRNGDFVTAVTTSVKPKVDKPVDRPTLAGYDHDPGFTCDKNPQHGGDGRKVLFHFDVKDQTQMPAGGWVIYLPYDYFDMTAEEGLRRAARGEHPTVYHYLDESCSASNCEIIQGEYTEYGVMFVTRSFSPFLVDCSTDTPATGGSTYKKLNGSSASGLTGTVMGATDYTSGIYGLTFKSSASFASFLGVQVDGKTIDKSNYIAEEGSIEVYLKAVYLQTLAAGKHTVTILSSEGNVTMDFTIGGVNTSPQTFDAGIAVYVGMALTSILGSAVVVGKKKEF